MFTLHLPFLRQRAWLLYVMVFPQFALAGCEYTVTDWIVGYKTMYDSLRPGTPKGYVRFDVTCIDCESTYALPVFMVIDDKETQIGQAWSCYKSCGSESRTTHSTLIAIEPGRHYVDVGTDEERQTICLDILEGMIIPVKMEFHELGRTSGSNGPYLWTRISYKWDMILLPGDPVPFQDPSGSPKKK